MKKCIDAENIVIDELRKVLEASLKDALNNHYTRDIALNALANSLICKCIESGIDKESFIKKLSDAWDYHVE